jgi:hypothetical protein
MADAIGTTAFLYTPGGGQLASETGPWAGDRGVYTYANRLRNETGVPRIATLARP